MKWLKYIGISLLGVTAITVAYHAWTQFKLLSKSDFKLGKWGIIDFTMDKALIEFSLIVENATDIEFTVIKQQYDIYMNGTFVVTFSSNKKWRIFANDKTEIKVVAEFNPRKSFSASLEALKGMFTNWKNIVFKTEGQIKVGTGLISTTIDIEDETKITDFI